MAEPTRHPRPGSGRRPLPIAVFLAVAVSAFFVAVSPAAAAKITAAYPAWSPTTATIDAGQSVEFESTESLQHGVGWGATAPETPSCTGVPGPATAGPWSGSCTFNQAGAYPFHCTLHASMTGTITVNSTGPSAPTVTAEAATNVKAAEATLKGSVNPNGESTTYWFEYGINTGYGQETTHTSGVTTSGSKSEPVTGLTPNTTYHFRMVAQNSIGTTNGPDGTFTTAGPPTATTDPAASVGSVQATLKGTVNPKGLETKYFFNYGTTAAYGQKTAETVVGSDTSAASVSKLVTGLSPETEYHFQIVAKNPAGEEKGVDRTFTTLAADTTDPQTTIKIKPADPTSSTTAEFTYESNEAGSTFQCRMDGEAFTECAPTGKTYTGLGEGPHTFQVRATDPSLNIDETPATYSFSVVLPVTQPEVKPPTVDPPPKVEPPPAVAPNTTITLKPKAKTKDRTPTFKFKSSLAGATYECKLDGKALKPCRSPLTTKSLSFAKHTLKVAAIVGGLKDGSPAVATFKVVKP